MGKFGKFIHHASHAIHHAAKSVEHAVHKNVVAPTAKAVKEAAPTIDTAKIAKKTGHAITHPEETAAKAVHAITHPLETAKDIQNTIVNPVLEKPLNVLNDKTGGVSNLILGSTLSQPEYLGLEAARAGSELVRTGKIKDSTAENLIRAAVPGGFVISNLDKVATNLGVPKSVRKYSTTPTSSTFNYAADAFVSPSIQRQAKDSANVYKALEAMGQKSLALGKSLVGIDTRPSKRQRRGQRQQQPRALDTPTDSKMPDDVALFPDDDNILYQAFEAGGVGPQLPKVLAINGKRVSSVGGGGGGGGMSMRPSFADRVMTKKKGPLATCPPRNQHNHNNFVVNSS